MDCPLVLWLLLRACLGARADARDVDWKFPADFFFGLATAPAHVEDQLDDQWLKFAQDGHVAAWKDVPRAAERLDFWSRPEVEIEIAAQTGVRVFRMGVDWTRLVPVPFAFNETAMLRYIEIIQMVRKAGMKVMMTLFHHSIPGWANEFGGWTSEKLLPHFEFFSRAVVDHIAHIVDFWTVFNEPTLFALLTYCTGLWPPGPPPSEFKQIVCFLPPPPFINPPAPMGVFNKAMDNIARAHIAFATYFKSMPNAQGKIGVAHNVGHNVPVNIAARPMYRLYVSQIKFAFIDAIIDHLDFIGLNYYSREWIGAGGNAIVDGWEYSEAGRCVDPNGLYTVLSEFWHRFHSKVKSIVITENGIADSLDVLRPSYLIEHLLAIHQAVEDGVNVEGYIHWTISDNWEWADGYCPKFGLAAVDRSGANLTRLKRPTFHLYSDIIKAYGITIRQRNVSWQLVQKAQNEGRAHPFCRGTGEKLLGGLDKPVQRPFAQMDWRFKPPDPPFLPHISLYMRSLFRRKFSLATSLIWRRPDNLDGVAVNYTADVPDNLVEVPPNEWHERPMDLDSTTRDKRSNG